LREDLDLAHPWQGRDTAFSMAFAEKPANPPGSRFLYSDTNFITLGALVERVAKTQLDKYCETHIFVPLKMTHTRFLPPVPWRPNIAPTQYDENNTRLRRLVNDPTARRTKVPTAVTAALQLTSTEKEELRWNSITGYNEAQTAARRVSTRNGSVQTGIDVLEAHNFDPVRAITGKKKIGLLTNQTGLDSQGRRTIDVLAHADGVSLGAIFSPEHGVT